MRACCLIEKDTETGKAAGRDRSHFLIKEETVANARCDEQKEPG